MLSGDCFLNSLIWNSILDMGILVEPWDLFLILFLNSVFDVKFAECNVFDFESFKSTAWNIGYSYSVN